MSERSSKTAIGHGANPGLRFLLSPVGLLCMGLFLVVAVFVVVDHQPHLAEAYSLMILTLCLVMHFLHGHPGGHAPRTPPRGGP